MGGIAEQSDAGRRPVIDRIAIAQHPHPTGFDPFEHAQYLRHLSLEVLPHDFLAAFGVPAFFVMIGVKDGDQVVELAAPQWIMHKMGARAGPEHDVGTPKIFWHVVAFENAAIGNVSRHPGLAVADHAFADFRPHAIAADERATFNSFAGVERYADVVAAVFEAIDPPAGFQRDEIAPLAGFEERGVDVGTVGDSIGLAESLQERVAERNIGYQLAGEGIAHLLRGRAMGVCEDGVLEADFLQHPKNVGAKLDAGTNLAKFRRLLENPDGKAMICECISGDKPADAAAGNEERGGTAIHTRHGLNLNSQNRSGFATTIKPEMAQ